MNEIINNNQSGSANAKPVGVGGWLLFFIVIITIVSPIRFLLEFAKDYLFAKEISESIPEVASQTGFSWQYFSINSAISFILVALGVWAGILLWRKNRSGIKLVNIFLVLSLLYIIFGIVYAILEPQLNVLQTINLNTLVFISSGIVFLWYIIWFIYFRKSKRVKNTYA